jgi:drug/metabolite transporter (DMT)-like permease
MEKLAIILGMCISTLFSAFGILFLKLSMYKHKLELKFDSIIKILTDIRLISGFFLYIIATIIFIYILRTTELSFLYPLTSLTYIYVSLFSYYILKEKYNRYKVLGVLLIVFGIVLISVGSNFN